MRKCFGDIPEETVPERNCGGDASGKAWWMDKGSPGGVRRGLRSHKKLERFYQKDCQESSRAIGESWSFTGVKDTCSGGARVHIVGLTSIFVIYRN
ncbi:hypothetical protein NPIL_479561 [Nephila pilipes]|uniref:Uncharacterized protein n=1 Tax=Nephila pilipes TaxID=299642 RepID=A0A8X6UI52_NEPPI|nr:hypothetical protein NPIL_479561 [Nephila pilipes]